MPAPPSLCAPDAPEALQAAGLRLMSRLWRASGGRAYAQLRTAVIGGWLARCDWHYSLSPCLVCGDGCAITTKTACVHGKMPSAAAAPTLAGFAAPGQQPGLALRVARAECLRDVCSADPDKAVELVGLLQVRGRRRMGGAGQQRDKPPGIPHVSAHPRHAFFYFLARKMVHASRWLLAPAPLNRSSFQGCQ